MFVLAGCLLQGETVKAVESDFVIEDGVLEAYTGTDTVVEVPKGVTTIGDGAFAEYSDQTDFKGKIVCDK